MSDSAVTRESNLENPWGTESIVTNPEMLEERDREDLTKIFGNTQSVTMEKYLKKIKEKESAFTIKEISKDLNRSKNTVRKYIYALRDEGFLIPWGHGMYQYLHVFDLHVEHYHSGDVVLGFHNLMMTHTTKEWGVSPPPEHLTDTTFFGVEIGQNREVKLPENSRGEETVTSYLHCTENPLSILEFYRLLKNLPRSTCINRLELNADYIGINKNRIENIKMKLSGNNNTINVYSKRMASYPALRVERKFSWPNGEMIPDRVVVRKLIAMVPKLE